MLSLRCDAPAHYPNDFVRFANLHCNSESELMFEAFEHQRLRGLVRGLHTPNIALFARSPFTCSVIFLNIY